jgi:hypothetical protein
MKKIIFIAIIFMQMIVHLRCSSLLVYHSELDICLEYKGRFYLSDFTVSEFYTGANNIQFSEEFRYRVENAMLLWYLIIPSDERKKAFNAAMDREIENTAKKVLGDAYNNLPDEYIFTDEENEKMRNEINIFDVHFKAAKLAGASYLVDGYALRDDNQEDPYYAKTILYLYDVQTRKVLFSVHKEKYLQAEEIYPELIDKFIEIIGNRLCVRR